MCLAVPMKLTSVDGVNAVADLDGVTRNVRVDMLDTPAVGDFVLVHAGLAIARIDENEAMETLSLLRSLSADEI